MKKELSTLNTYFNSTNHLFVFPKNTPSRVVKKSEITSFHIPEKSIFEQTTGKPV